MQVAPPGVAVTTVATRALPPSLSGGDQVTTTCPFPGVNEVIVGAEGTVDGEMGLLGAEEVDVPAAFVATTVMMYALPLMSAVMSQLVA